MQYEVVVSEKLTPELVAAWREICHDNERYVSPYFTPDFISIAGQVRSDVQIVFARNEAGAIVGILPVQMSGIGLRLARPVGAPFSDYNGPILKAGYEHIAGEMLSYVKGAAYSFSGMPVVTDSADVLNADNADADLPIDISKIDPELLKFGLSIRGKARAFIADLSVGYDAYLESRRSEYPKHFKKSRRLWRQAEKEVGKLELVFHDPSEEALDQLIEWKREQFQRTGLHDVLSPDWTRQMLRKCFQSQTPHLAGVLTTLRCDGKLMAAEFGVRAGDLLHGWISAYNPEYHTYSPGMLLQTRLLEAASHEGIKTADLGVGAEHYKKYYASRYLPVCNGVLVGTSLGGAVRGIGGEIWNNLEEASLGPVSKVAVKLRRRLDVILSTEQTMTSRKDGIMRALRNF